MQSRDIEPEGKTAEVDGGEERFGVFGVSCGDARPSVQVQKGIFDKVA
jgi:hypothetical protein